ncbi:MAG: response regulator, partial [Defluviitaleaceae bacterium]|nr:response regulator [Defluviitaleaceae bacterium]
ANNRVDVALMDVALPRKDGLFILEELNKRPADKRPAVIVMISGISQEHITNQAFALGADYYMVKPIDVDLLIKRSLEILESKAGSIPKSSPPQPQAETASVPAASAKSAPRREVEAFVTDMLHRIQISTNLKGYNYMKLAIVMGIENPKVLNGITKSLYPAIARECRTTATRVERAIRHAIDSAWAKGCGGNYQELLGYGDSAESKPTNSVFITSLVELYGMRHES